MASHIRVETGGMAGGAGRNRWTGRAGHRAEELKRRIGADKPIRGVLANVIYHGVRIIILGSAVVVDLAKDARGEVRRKRCCDRRTARSGDIGTNTRTEGICSSRVRDLRIGETMLLRVGSGSSHDPGGVNDGDEGKSRIAVDYRKKKTRGAVLRESHDSAGCGRFIAAEVAAARVREGSSVCRRLTSSDASGTVIIGRRARYNRGGQHRRRCVTA